MRAKLELKVKRQPTILVSRLKKTYFFSWDTFQKPKLGEKRENSGEKPNLSTLATNTLIKDFLYIFQSRHYNTIYLKFNLSIHLNITDSITWRKRERIQMKNFKTANDNSVSAKKYYFICFSQDTIILYKLMFPKSKLGEKKPHMSGISIFQIPKLV